MLQCLTDRNQLRKIGIAVIVAAAHIGLALVATGRR